MLHYCGVILHALKLTFTYYLLLSTYSIYSFGCLSILSNLHTELCLIICCSRILLSFCKIYTILSLLTGQFSGRITAAFSLSLSCCKSLHSYRMWSTDCSPSSHEHNGLYIILYLYKYVLILPWPVTIVVKLGVALILSFNLSAIFGKKDFVITPFEDLSHSFCHCFTVCSFNSLHTALFGILV